jgi:hypothetical protein
LPDPVGPGHEEQPTRTADQVLTDIRQADLLKSQQAVRDLPEHQRQIALLAEHRHTEPGGLAVREAEVRAALLLEFLLVPLGGDRLHERHHVVRVEHLGLQVAQPPADADRGLPPHRQVEVARVELDDGVEQSVDLNR